MSWEAEASPVYPSDENTVQLTFWLQPGGLWVEDPAKSSLEIEPQSFWDDECVLLEAAKFVVVCYVALENNKEP